MSIPALIHAECLPVLSLLILFRLKLAFHAASHFDFGTTFIVKDTSLCVTSFVSVHSSGILRKSTVILCFPITEINCTHAPNDQF